MAGPKARDESRQKTIDLGAVGGREHDRRRVLEVQPHLKKTLRADFAQLGNAHEAEKPEEHGGEQKSRPDPAVEHAERQRAGDDEKDHCGEQQPVGKAVACFFGRDTSDIGNCNAMTAKMQNLAARIAARAFNRPHRRADGGDGLFAHSELRDREL